MSDVDVVERSGYDMSFKFFLDMAPEEEVIELSSLTKFRKLRLKDVNLLDILIDKTVEIALEYGLIKTKSIIIDSTHTKARYNQKRPREVLLEYSKRLRKAVYEIDESMRDKFPPKVNNGVLEDEIEYCQKLIAALKSDEALSSYPAVKERMNLLEETVNDDLEQLALSKDQDARVGHKTYDTSLLQTIYRTGYRYKKAGVIVLDIVAENQIQGSLFDGLDREKHAAVMKALDQINARYGRDTVKIATQGSGQK